MADLKISQLSAASALSGAEALPVVQSGSTKKTTIDKILSPAAGKGIDFSANTGAAGVTSELLDWYEEGSFIATLTGSTGSPITPVTTTGYYTRIGRQVTVQFDFQGVSTLGATGGLQVTGVPYSAMSARIYAGAAVGNQAYSALQLIGSTIDVLTLATGANIPAGGVGIYLFCTITYMV